MLFWFALKRIGYKIVPSTVRLSNTDGVVMTSLFSLPHDSKEHLEVFGKLNGLHANMSFTIENENQNRMSFLHVPIIRENKSFATSVYCKPTFSGVTHSFKAFYHLHMSLALFTHLLIDASEYAQVRVNYTLN